MLAEITDSLSYFSLTLFFNDILMTSGDFKKQVSEGIPSELPDPKPYDHSLNHAPKRKDILTLKEEAGNKKCSQIFSGKIP